MPRAILTAFRPTKDDIYAGFNAQCAVLGIGSLAMGRNFGTAGIWPATCALVLMFIINATAQVALSRAMFLAPPHVETFSDLGGHVYGKPGRIIALITQFGACLMIPIAFLVLGGAYIMPLLFGPLNHNIYIAVMALALLPFVLIRTLKEGAWLALLGALGAILGIAFAVIDSVSFSPFYAETQPKFEFEPILSVFGSMAMAFGSAVVIPAIQRDHPDPQRMPMILVVVLILTTLCYYGIGLHGYIQFGCVAPENLMKSMSSPGWRYAALIWFWIHILIAFAVYLNPALFLFERFVFGNDQEEFKTIETPKKGFLPRLKTRLPSFALRTTVVVLQTFTAMLLQSSFEDLCDFAGASCLTLSAMILPLLFYLKVEKKASQTIRGVFYTMIVVCALAGCYTSYIYMRNIVKNTADFSLFVSERPTFATERNLTKSIQRFCRATSVREISN